MGRAPDRTIAGAVLRRVGLWPSQGVYRLSDALWLDKVLVNRQGSAVSLGAILLWIAQRLALPVVPVIFPTQMLLRADPETSEEIWLINPFNGVNR